jgi:hypothetical protein
MDVAVHERVGQPARGDLAQALGQALDEAGRTLALLDAELVGVAVDDVDDQRQGRGQPPVGQRPSSAPRTVGTVGAASRRSRRSSRDSWWRQVRDRSPDAHAGRDLQAQDHHVDPEPGTGAVDDVDDVADGLPVGSSTSNGRSAPSTRAASPASPLQSTSVTVRRYLATTSNSLLSWSFVLVNDETGAVPM